MKKKYTFFIAIVPFFVVLDQITKYAIHNRFRLGESISIITNYFNLTYVRNTGAAFGFMAQAEPGFRVPFFLTVPLLALGVIAYMFKQLPDDDKKMSIALSLVVAGAIGNLLDRAILGFVIDFLDFHWRYQVHFPSFNVADTVICIGVGLMMLDLFQRAPESEVEAASDPSAKS
jgi:signal peptidase II